jgi:DNA polymerase III subunit epsilon
VGLAARPGADVLLEEADFAVVDLETTGLSPGRSRICEIGAVRIRKLELAGSFETFVDPGTPVPALVTSLTGIADADLRGAPTPARAVRAFLGFAGDAVIVAHNARFDVAFLDREVERLTGRRLAGPVVDTVSLARRLLAGRVSRVSLSSLAYFFGTSARPCHRALPDAEATAEILLGLVGLAQERGARTVADLCDLAVPRARRAYAKRSLVYGAPTRPGVYLFRDANDRVLYVGRARDLRARLRSYFRSERQRPSVEAALGVLERVEWRVLGSELEAALDELRLIRELRPPANARASRPDRALYLRRRGDRIVVGSTPSEWGPLQGRRRAELAARALADATDEELGRLLDGGPLPRLRARLRDLSDSLRYEDAARLRDRIAALEAVVRRLATLERLRRAELCLLAPALEEGFERAFVVCGGRIAAVRTVPRRAGSLELAAALAEARRVEPSRDAADADELLLVASYLRRPPPELRIVRLDRGKRLRAVA